MGSALVRGGCREEQRMVQSSWTLEHAQSRQVTILCAPGSWSMHS